MILVHGAGASYVVWVEQIREFSATHRLIVPDLSGHGLSESYSEDITIDGDYACELAALVEHLDLKGFVLVGHSMGGGVVMAYTLNKEFRPPRGLVLVDTSSNLDLSRLAVGLAIETIENYLNRFRKVVVRDHSPVYDIKGSEIHHRKITPRLIKRDLKACDDFDVTDRLSDIDVPTFVLVGEDDDIIPPYVALGLEKALPRADIAVVRGADHSPMIEQPAEFNRLLREFFDWLEKGA